jgi:hypothetical protein
LGYLDKLDLIITSDTGWERRRTYAARDWYAEWFRSHGLRVEIVDGGDVRKRGAEQSIHIPFWTSTGGPLRRQCTREYKVRPIRRRVRELMGYPASKPPQPIAGAVEQWLGYTWEETQRVRDSEVEYVVMRYPLIEMRWPRAKCVDFLVDKGLPVPVKSACIGCPYRDAVEYLEMREQDPDEFEDAVAFDEKNRHNPRGWRDGTEADELYIYKNAKTQTVEALANANLEEVAKWRDEKGEQLWLDLCDGPCWT